MYPKALTKKEMIEWIEDLNLPAKLGATQIADSIIILRKVSDAKKVYPSEKEAVTKWIQEIGSLIEDKK